MAVPDKTLPDQSEGKVGCLPALARLYWLAGGNVVLIFCAIYIVLRKAGFTVYLLYVLSVISLIVIRFIDIKFFKGETMNGEPTSLGHWRRYTLGLLVFAGALYVVSSLLAKWLVF